MTPRIAVVQHGDVREARRLRTAGQAEPYYGMHYSQGFLDEWMAGRPHLVVSLNAPVYRERQGDGLLVGLPEPSPIRPLPGTATQMRWAFQIIREIRRFPADAFPASYRFTVGRSSPAHCGLPPLADAGHVCRLLSESPPIRPRRDWPDRADAQSPTGLRCGQPPTAGDRLDGRSRPHPAQGHCLGLPARPRPGRLPVRSSFGQGRSRSFTPAR